MSPTLRALVLASLVAWISPNAVAQMPATPIISEFLAENTENLPDEDGDLSDWIEIYNPTDEPVVLEGYSLTDDAEIPGKWMLPPVEIQPGGYLVVFASGKDRIDPAGALHTNFSLENSGEYLALYAPGLADPVSAFQPFFPGQYENISFGISGEDPSVVGFIITPSPNTINGEAYQGLVRDTKFNPDRGFILEPTPVEITSATEGVTIRYTTDGSVPTLTNGQNYNGPITIDRTTVLRAVAFKDGFIPTNLDTHTYVLPSQVKTQPVMNPTVVDDPAYAEFIDEALGNTLPAMAILVDENAFFGIDGIHTNFQLSGPAAEVPVGIEYFSPADPNDRFAVGGGIRIHGGNARWHPKKPFRLFFRSRYGDARLNHSLFEGSPVDSFDQLLLRPGGHDSWSLADTFGSADFDLPWHGTIIRDQFLRQTENEMGLLSPKGKYVHLYINGLYWGVYDLHERPNAAYFADHLGGDEADYDVLHHPEFINEDYAIVDGSGEAWEMLQRFAETQVTNAEEFDRLAALIDIDDFIDSLIVRMWSGDFDWCGPVFQGDQNVTIFSNKNWYAGRRSRNGTPEDKFLFFAWDAEMSMGLHLLVNLGNGNVPQRVLNFDLSAVNDLGSPVRPYDSLRRYAPFQRRFSDRMQKHLFGSGLLSPEKTQARLDTLIEQLDLPMIAESARWGNTSEDGTVFTRDEHWRPEVDWMRDTFLTQRNDVMVSDFRRRSIFPNLNAPIFAHDGGAVIEGFTLQISAESFGEVYYTTDGSDPALFPTYQMFKLIPPVAEVEWLVPTQSNGGLVFGSSRTWTDSGPPPNPDFWWGPDEGEYMRPGIGYDVGDGAFAGLFAESSRMTQIMYERNSSVLIRVPFTVPTQQLIDNIDSFFLRMRYDDGFVAYLNSQFIGQGNAPATLTPTSVALNPREDVQALQAESFDITDSARQFLRVGRNMLAIHGLNSDTASTDFLILPELELVTLDRPGGPSTTALRYSGPIPLEGSTTVKARFLAGNGIWSALTEARFSVNSGITPGDLIVSELNYRPAPPTTPEELALTEERSAFEFVELLNVSGRQLDLTGAKFVDGIQFNFPEVLLDPGEYVLVVNNEAAFALRYGMDDGRRIAGIFERGSKLSDGGERLTLVTSEDDVVFSFQYRDTAPWPTTPDGSGYSLVFRPGIDVDFANIANWSASLDPGGHPGRAEISAYTEWRGIYFPTAEENVDAVAGPAADPDADGWVNLFEYVFGTHPRIKSQTVDPLGFGQVLVEDDPTRAFQFLRRLGVADLRFEIEFSSDLADWTLVEFDEDAAVVQPNLHGRQNVQVPMVDALARFKYARLRAIYRP